MLNWYCDLYACVPPNQVQMLKTNALMVVGGGACGRCSDHEGGALVMALVPYKRASGEIASPLLPSEDTTRGLQPGRGLSSDPDGTLLSDFSLQNCKQYISAIYEPSSLWCSAIAAQMDCHKNHRHQSDYHKNRVHGQFAGREREVMGEVQRAIGVQMFQFSTWVMPRQCLL